MMNERKPLFDDFLNRQSLCLILCAFFAYFCLQFQSFSQIPAPEEFHEITVSEEAKKFFQEIWSPYCPGLSLHDCTSAQAASLRRDIAQKFQQGRSKNEILTELKSLFGETVSMIPEKTGFNWAAYYLPGIGILLILGLLLLRVMRPTPKFKRHQSPGPLAASLDPSQKEKITSWLKK